MTESIMFSNLLYELQHIGNWLSSPLSLIIGVFWIWMLVDSIRRREWFWTVCIFLFSVISAVLYFFLVYRQSAAALTTRGFELPGAYHRRRIKELQAQIHHLDKAHHHSQLGDIYFHQGKLPLAEASYRAALERDPADIDTRAHLGQCLLRQGKALEARPLLEGVVAEDPKHDYGHSLMALAETLAALGETDQAIQVWQRVIENHSYPRARVQLAELYLARNRPADAQGLLNEVLVEDPYTPAFQRRRDRIWVRRARALAAKIK